jgi:hypothetical protein
MHTCLLEQGISLKKPNDAATGYPSYWQGTHFALSSGDPIIEKYVDRLSKVPLQSKHYLSIGSRLGRQWMLKPTPAFLDSAIHSLPRHRKITFGHVERISLECEADRWHSHSKS